MGIGRRPYGRIQTTPDCAKITELTLGPFFSEEREMKVCVVQTRPEAGDFESNARQHEMLIRLAPEQNAEIVVFPY